MSFCKYCGSVLEEGQQCNCEGAQAERAAVVNTAPVQEATPVQQVAPTQQTAPAMTDKQQSAAKLAKLSLIFTIVHFALFVVQLIVTFAVVFKSMNDIGYSYYGYSSYNMLSAYSGLTAVSTIFGLLRFATGIAGLVLMIIARVKDKFNKMAKVLMWIYIVAAILLVLSIIAVVVLLSAFAAII